MKSCNAPAVHLDCTDGPLVKGQPVKWDFDAPHIELGFDTSSAPTGVVTKLWPRKGGNAIPAVQVRWDADGHHTTVPAVWLEGGGPSWQRPEERHEICPGRPNDLTDLDLFVVCEGHRAGRATADDVRLYEASSLGVFRRREGGEELTIRRYRIFRLDDKTDLRAPCNSDLELCERREMTPHGPGFEDAFGEMVFLAEVRDDGSRYIG